MMNKAQFFIRRRFITTIALFFYLVFFAAASASAQVEYFDNAFARAADPPPIGGGGGWVITAKVNMKASGKEYISARGPVKLQSDGSLTGDLPMSIDDKAIANNALSISIRKSYPAAVTVTRMIAGKPFLNKPAVILKLPVDPSFNYLIGSITWSDGDRVIQIFLETEFIRKTTGSGDTTGGTPKRTGARYQIGGFMRVTNSSDGIGDDTVEVYGVLYLHRMRNGKQIKTWKLIYVIEQDANNGFELPFFDNNFIDFYDDEREDEFTMEGAIFDRDRGQGLTGDDLMFAGDACMTNFSIYTLMRKTVSQGSMLCKGDEKSESADIRIFIKKVKDL